MRLRPPLLPRHRPQAFVSAHTSSPTFCSARPSPLRSLPIERPTRRIQMVDQISLTFLGTAAGKPSITRNVSCLALKLDGIIWIIDAGEASQHQFMRSSLRMGSIEKFFITHCHGDHIFGIVPLLCTMASGEVIPTSVDPRIAPAELAPTEIYGPAGLRQFLRCTLRYSYSGLARQYVVHELLFEGEDEDVSDDLHFSERRGRNIRADANGEWVDILHDETKGIRVSAGRVLHTVPCLGYIFSESPRPLPLALPLYLPHLKRNAPALSLEGIKNPLSLLSKLQTQREDIVLPDGTVLSPSVLGGPGRKLTILGDTYDASGCRRLAQDSDVLVHESTNAYLPTLDASQAPSSTSTITEASVLATAASHGHSVPSVAGSYAASINAGMLILNHLSVKYVAPPSLGEVGFLEKDKRRDMLVEIGRLAAESFGGERKVLVARDFLEVVVPRRKEQ